MGRVSTLRQLWSAFPHNWANRSFSAAVGYFLQGLGSKLRCGLGFHVMKEYSGGWMLCERCQKRGRRWM